VRYIGAMKPLTPFHRIVDLFCKFPAARIPEAEFATADGWLDERQWLEGLPADRREPALWGWWRTQ
jgi:hypothetical protein